MFFCWYKAKAGDCQVAVQFFPKIVIDFPFMVLY